MDENLKKAIEALERIAEYDVSHEHGYRDEWSEAAAFNKCQKIAEEMLKEIRDLNIN